jgi:DNA mismatch repair protein MutS2
MNRHALQVLQYPEALELVARYASSALGADAVRALQPSDAIAWVADELRRVDQMAGFQLRASDWFVPPIPDLRAALQRLGVEGSVWDGPTLRDSAELMSGARATRRAILQHTHDYPLVAEIAERLTKLEEPEDRIRVAIDDNGGVRDGASRELARLRRDIRGARSRIVQRLEQFIAALPERYQVADASVSVREGRFVIPVRRDARAEVGGIVHDESATGNTLFVEPPIAIELMNELRALELAETREVQRILRELTSMLRPHRQELSDSLEAMVAIDSLFARGRYTLEFNGRRPDVLPRGANEYVAVESYHPLLLAGPERVVPFDLRLDPGERTLLVSGPNTGGKTVLLKAIGLISAMAQAGIIPPVGKGTKLPLFADVFADIGDEQSIEASLSTFSAHLKNLREVLEGADRDSLVLIDEIGSGTDPAEGGALAQSILVELTRRGTLTVATTHLGQLKLLAGEEPGVVNASLQFDAVELKPTYRLLKGLPGRSYGLAIARRLRFPEDVLARAESYLPKAERDLGHLLLEVEAKEKQLAESLEAAQAAKREADDVRAGVEEREAALRKREKEAERRARQQARDLLLGAREEVERAIREVREAGERGARGAELEDTFRAARRTVEEQARRQAERARASQDAAAPAAEIENGARVRVGSTGAEGTVIEVRDERATVEIGGVRMQVSSSDLTPVDAPQPAATARSGRAGSWTSPDVQVASEVDLRGLRADEVSGQLLPALDAAIQVGLPSLRIIHGKGTGALRQVVTELLRADPRIGRFRPGGLGEGGTGVTVVELS